MRFQSLSEIIRRNIEQYGSMNQFETGTPLSIESGQFQYLQKNYDTIGVLRWGFSVWGIDHVIGADYATDEEIQEL